MTGRPGRPRTLVWSPRVRVGVVVALVVIFALGALRLMPGSPFAAHAAARWGEPAVPAQRSGDDAASRDAARTQPTPTPTLPALPLRATEVRLDVDGWYSWALQDTRTGEITGSANLAETSTTASLIKAWIGADYLRRAAEQGDTPSDTRLEQVRVMIRDSDNEAAQALWKVVGQAESIERLIPLCKLTDSSAYKNMWSNTRLSPRDITRLGACIADGRAAGPQWTTWLLDEMRAVRGAGDFGVRKAFPDAEQKLIAIKNGWVDRTAEQENHVNCLAIGDGWTMGVMSRYPVELGYEYGMQTCQKVAEQLVQAAGSAQPATN